ncbi:hypothetical protein [Streptomyces murinus]|uniref:hypothetical protein n=1 Tax=Streptomyces murinus TaxID=33900 RepID=UPI003827A613
MKWPFVSRRRYDEAETARRQLAARHASLEELYAGASIVNTCVTEELAAARNRIAEYGVRRTVSDVLVEHDVHRKALADALGDQKYHLNWDQLIAEVARLNAAAEAWMADHAAEKKRADRLQARLDDALGLNTHAIVAGAMWRDRRTDKKGHQ